MAGVHRSEFTESMKKDMYRWYFQDYQEISPAYANIFNIVPSDAAYDQHTVAVGLGDLLEKPEGTDLRADNPLEAWTVICKNRSFGRMIRFSRESVDDAKKVSNLMKATIGTWSEAVGRTKDRWYAKFFSYGAYTAGHAIFNNTIPGVVTDSSGNMIYDGQAFFGTAHPDKAGGTYSNTAGSTSLTHTNLQTYYTVFTDTNAKDERGNEIEMVPDTLIIKADELFNARVILANTAIPGSQDNDINVLAALVNILVWPRISGSNIWILSKLKYGLTATDRQGVEMDFWEDETSKDMFASIYMRWGGCVTDWRGNLAGNLSTS